MDAKKAETIITAAAGLKYWEWRAIADMIDRKFIGKQAQVEFTPQDAEHGLQMLIAEQPRG